MLLYKITNIAHNLSNYLNFQKQYILLYRCIKQLIESKNTHLPNGLKKGTTSEGKIIETLKKGLFIIKT